MILSILGDKTSVLLRVWMNRNVVVPSFDINTGKVGGSKQFVQTISNVWNGKLVFNCAFVGWLEINTQPVLLP
jgi:hypothetical protein